MQIRWGTLALAWALSAPLASAATFVVDSIGDEPDADTADGLCRTALTTCTLRAAIEQANALAGADVIQFNIPGTGIHTISPVSALPTITDDAGLAIDGYTQPGSSPNTLAIGDDAVILIEIDGSGVGGFARGLRVSASNASIRGLALNSFDGFALYFEGGFGHRVVGCFVGTDPSGLVAKPNNNGVVIDTSAAVGSVSSTQPPLAVIGTSAAADRNVISGNSSGGIAILSSSIVSIQGNYIGTDASGTHAIPNLGAGVSLQAVQAILGGLGVGTGNLISGNQLGVVSGFGSTNFISGNRIGTDATGMAPVPNGSGIDLQQDIGTGISGNLIAGNTLHGIKVYGGSNITISGNIIGASGAGMGNGAEGVFFLGPLAKASVGGVPNEIAFNGAAGIRVGLTASDIPYEVAIHNNSIHDNAGLGIDLVGDGVSPNNDCDSGRGPNLGQNYPVLTAAVSVSGGTRVIGSLNSVSGATYLLDFYSSPACDPSGYGEGTTWLGNGFVSTDGACNGTFDTVMPVVLPAGAAVTATATDPAGNTSEFSACRALTIGQQLYTLPPCRIVDTRGPAGPYGGPALGIGGDRTLVIAGQCGVPVDAQAVALNVAVTQPTNDGHLILFPSGTPAPVPPAVNYAAGQTRARDGIFALGLGGGLDVHVNQTSGTVHLILDVTGYFR